MNDYYNKLLKERAKRLRSESTTAEIRLWTHVLGKKQLLGYGFQRQRPLGMYIVDFICRELQLIIEVDGPVHLNKDQSKSDEVRDKLLNEQGYVVQRFTNDEVLNDINGVRQKLIDLVEGIRKRKSCR